MSPRKRRLKNSRPARLSSSEDLTARLPRYLTNALYVVVLCCVVVVSFAFTLNTYHPYQAIKELLLHGFVLGGIALLFALGAITGTVPVKRNLLVWSVLAYLGYNVVSFVRSPDADRIDFTHLVILIAFFLLAAVAIDSRKKLDFLLYAIGLVVIGSAVYAIFQFLGFEHTVLLSRFGSRGLGMRVFSFFGNPNYYAGVLTMTLPLLLAGLFVSQKRSLKYFFGLSLLMGAAGLFLASTRSAILACIISVALFFAIVHLTHNRRRYLALVAGTLLLAAGGFAFGLAADPATVQGLGLRQYLWQKAIEIGMDHPVFGAGVGSFKLQYPLYRKKSEEFALGQKNHEIKTLHPHNEFLEIFSDLGAIGLILFAGILGAFLNHYYRHWDFEKRYLAAGNTCAMVAVLISNLYDVNLRAPYVALFFWLNLALPLAIWFPAQRDLRVIINWKRVLLMLLPIPLLSIVVIRHSWPRYGVEHHMFMGLSYQLAEKYKMAEPFLEQATQTDPKDKEPWYYLGICRYQLEKYEASKEAFFKVLALDPNFLQTHFWMANCYYRSGDLEKAEEAYRKMLRVNDVYGPAYYGLGLIALSQDKVEPSIQYFEKAHRLTGDPSTQKIRLHALRQLIDIYEARGDEEKVREYVAERHKLEQEVTRMMKRLGKIP